MFGQKFLAILWLLCVGGNVATSAGVAGESRFRQPSPARTAAQITATLTAAAPDVELRIDLKIPAGSYFYADRIAPILPDGIRAELRDHSPPQIKTDDPLPVYVGEAFLIYRLTGDVPSPLNFALTYQECTEKLCYLPTQKILTAALPNRGDVLPASAEKPPRENLAPRSAEQIVAQWRQLADKFAVEAQITGYAPRDEFSAWLAGGNQNIAARLDRGLNDYGLFAMALLLLPLGALLNLTPCVLPMIPINLAIIGATDNSRKRGWYLGALYGAGMAAAYGLLGLAAVALGTRFGALNSSPIFNFLLAAIFIALGLAMFEVWDLDFSRMREKFQVNTRREIGVFFLGALTALLAGACVAPALTWTLALAAKLAAQGEIIGWLLPFLLGAGLGAPYPLLGAGIARLPKPGKWMRRVRQFFGVIILAMAIYYGQLGARLWRINSAAENYPQISADTVANGWSPDVIAAMQTAERERRPVLINFTAMVCKSCDLMKATTLRDPQVQALLRDFITVETVADNPHNPLGAPMIAYYGIIGAPTYVILRLKP